MRTLMIEPLTKEAFAPFGDVIETDGSDHFMINNGSTMRFHRLAEVETATPEDKAIISIFRAEAQDMPFTVRMLERHPLGSQAFIPLLGNPFLIVVAPVGDEPVSDLVRAFVSNGRQGINYHRGVWHHPVLTIEKRDDFLVVDRSGSGNNCDEHFFKEDQLLFLAPTNKRRSNTHKKSDGQEVKTVEAHLMEWLNLSVRWIHMITGVAWIGASFYFVWLENNLNRANPKDGLAGDLWAIHGGGIYHLESTSWPPTMPENLHWFKWEAYFTWMSGIALLCLVFYFNPALYLIAPGSTMSGPEAVAIGIGSLIAGWFIYDFLCDSALGKRPALLGFVLFVLLVAAAFGLSKVFSGRGAYLHVGAIIGTIMVGNVFRTIMPAQRALVAAIKEGRSPDPALPAKGLLRSRHNNYFTLPVLFIMISNHFPSTYGSQYNWLILAGIAVLAVLVRHYFNTRHDSHKYAWTLPVAALGMICLAYVTGPKPVSTAPETAKVIKYQPLPETALGGVKAADAPPVAPAPAAAPVATVDFEQVHKVIQERCTVCHSATPSSPLFSAAPAGVMFDTAQQIQLMAPRIQAQAVVTPIMPLGNITQMTQQERDLVGAWINAGARTN